MPNILHPSSHPFLSPCTPAPLSMAISSMTLARPALPYPAAQNASPAIKAINHEPCPALPCKCPPDFIRSMIIRELADHPHTRPARNPLDTSLGPRSTQPTPKWQFQTFRLRASSKESPVINSSSSNNSSSSTGVQRTRPDRPRISCSQSG